MEKSEIRQEINSEIEQDHEELPNIGIDEEFIQARFNKKELNLLELEDDSGRFLEVVNTYFPKEDFGTFVYFTNRIFVSDKGKLVTIVPEHGSVTFKITKPQGANRGRIPVVGFVDKKSNRYYVYLQRLVANKFLPRKPGKNYLINKDGNPLNCDVNNLEWVDDPTLNTEMRYQKAINEIRTGYSNNPNFSGNFIAMCFNFHIAPAKLLTYIEKHLPKEFEDFRRNYYLSLKNKHKMIECINQDGNIRWFGSTVQAAKYLGLHKPNIVAAMRKGKSSSSYYFRRVFDTKQEADTAIIDYGEDDFDSMKAGDE